MTALDTSEYPTITISQVDELIGKLEAETTSQYEVYRARNDQVIQTFDSASGARDFIEDQDYDANRVLVRSTQSDLTTIDNLVYLRNFRQEALSDCPNFRDGATLYRVDMLDASFCRTRNGGRYPSTDFYASPFNRIDWRQVAEDVRISCINRASYATLRTQRYYGIDGLL